MKDYHRIDKSRYSGRYIGYAANQVWIIIRTSRQSQWVARCRDEPWRESLRADTLRQINNQLEAVAQKFEAERNAQRAVILANHQEGSVH